MCIPALIYVRWQRKREGGIATTSRREYENTRKRGYAIVFITILLSSFVEASQLTDLNDLLGSRDYPFSANSGIVIIFTALEVVRLLNRKQ